MMKNKHTWLLAAVAGLGLPLATAASDTYNFRTVVKTGDAVPELGGIFLSFGPPHINTSGQAAFLATRTGDVGTFGAWVTSANDPSLLERIILTHTQAPGLPPGTTFGGSLGHFELNDAGNVAVSASVSGLPGNGMGLFRYINGELTKVAVPGDSAPGIGGGVVFHNLPISFGFNEGDLMSFTCNLSGTGVNSSNNSAIYMHWFGGLNLVKRKGSPAPPVEFGWTWGADYLTVVQIGNDGRLTFPSQLNTANGDTATRWSGWPGLLTLGTMAGTLSPLNYPFVNQQTPGLPHNTMTEDGFSFVHGIEVNGPVHTGIWLRHGNTIDTIATEDWPGPIGTYSTLGSGFYPTSTAFDSSITFRARIAATPEPVNTAIFLKKRDQPTTVIVREGDPAPGYGAGVVFDDFLAVLSQKTLADEAGHVYFEATVFGPGIDNSNNSGLWVSEPNGELRPIVRSGQWITLNDDSDRQVESFSLIQGQGRHTGNRHGVNSHGHVGLQITFTDNTHAVVIAEPASCLGDLNNDGNVDGLDLLILLSAWGSCDDCLADLNGDGAVDGLDLLMMLANWGPCP